MANINSKSQTPKSINFEDVPPSWVGLSALVHELELRDVPSRLDAANPMAKQEICERPFNRTARKYAYSYPSKIFRSNRRPSPRHSVEASSTSPPFIIQK